ncbi:flagellar hook basal-body protein [Photobacterium sp. GJ3]|uniref:flagellar hook-basal body complex protein n=1 Tax=Photobacterium sp. GJ3 TaxID=2829502 RepID=UPI001B8D5C44|nr:flagellar hook-basal body complex protein [Photobacterium sp. GJ3]QUJ68509.1 flagellar hook basal-body protein [Photobacterium sp. GJ3]
MDKISGIVLHSLSRDMHTVNQISTNTQHVTTTGFKALLVSDAAVTDQVKAPGQVIDMAQGELKQTGRHLDLAVQGAGWFVLRSGKTVALTRNGQFQLDRAGYVVDSRGFRLQSLNGDIQLDSTHIRVDSDGKISDTSGSVEHLILASVGEIYSDQYHQGHILYEKMPKLEIDSQSQVLQGYLEQSNVDSASEVVELMTAKRHIQTMQKTLAAYDQVLKKTINELGK